MRAAQCAPSANPTFLRHRVERPANSAFLQGVPHVHRGEVGNHNWMMGGVLNGAKGLDAGRHVEVQGTRETRSAGERDKHLQGRTEGSILALASSDMACENTVTHNTHTPHTTHSTSTPQDTTHITRHKTQHHTQHTRTRTRNMPHTPRTRSHTHRDTDRTHEKRRI